MLLLVRHGVTAANLQGLLLGRADPPLTDQGRRQAAALAAVLPPPDRVISSPLRRARDTAAAFGVAVEVDDRWTELDYGDFDGTPADAVDADVWRRWSEDVSYAPPGGESLEDLGERVRAACRSVVEDAASDLIVVVTHVSPIKAAIAWALGASDAIAWRMFVEDASVSRVDVRDGIPVLRWFNRHPTPDL